MNLGVGRGQAFKFMITGQFEFGRVLVKACADRVPCSLDKRNFQKSPNCSELEFESKFQHRALALGSEDGSWSNYLSILFAKVVGSYPKFPKQGQANSHFAKVGGLCPYSWPMTMPSSRPSSLNPWSRRATPYIQRWTKARSWRNSSAKTTSSSSWI